MKPAFALLAFALAAGAPAADVRPAGADQLADAIRADLPSLMAIYRDFHAHPELAMEETRSAARLADEAKRLGFAVTSGVGKTGVVAVLRNGPGPVLLLRADMDGLQVTEQTGLPFAAKSGVMHACGHDTHMTTWIAVARRLAAARERWSGTLVMIGQPGEEAGEGARAMLKDGLFTRFPKPTHALAFHDSASLPAGTIGYTPGAAFANADNVEILVKGVGGHGAMPQNTKDPVVLGARIVGTLQTLVSRELDPQDAAVVTVGSFQAGSKPNIIPDEARLLVTVRSTSEKTRRALLEGIDRIVRGEAIAAGVPEDRMPVANPRPDPTPAVINTPGLTERSAALFASRFGGDRVRRIPAVMAAEDFGRYHRADTNIESLIFWVGGVPAAKWREAGGDTAKLPSLHSPLWAPDAETVIATATEAMVTAALGVLGKQ